MKIKILVIITLLVFSIALAGCDERDPLLGTWEEPSSGIKIEFKDDGTLVMGRGGVSYSMDYEKQDPDIILFKGSVDGSIPDQRMTYKVEDDHLILSIDGIDTVFNRKK
jgi:hypothetical protein